MKAITEEQINAAVTGIYETQARYVARAEMRTNHREALAARHASTLLYDGAPSFEQLVAGPFHMFTQGARVDIVANDDLDADLVRFIDDDDRVVGELRLV